jgi:hypothetical protein
LSKDIIASSQPGGWMWHHSPVVACDLSQSQYKGNVYICFSDLRNGTNDRDIWLIKSTNSGNNWSSPLRVNNDSPGHNQELPWISVDRITGYIWILFYDGRNYSNGIYNDAYIARSTDGGSTFQNVKISNNISWTLSQIWNGDYIGITAYNNKVRPVWTASLGYGYSNLYTAIIDTFTIGVRSISSSEPGTFMLYQNYPNPFNPVTTIRYQIKDSRFVTLKVYDVLGKEIATLVNEFQKAGTYETQFPNNQYTINQLASGVYFYRIRAEDYSDTKKLMLLK